MGTELTTLLLAALVYLSFLLLVAEATERDFFPRSLARHPAIFSLSLGVYATSWTFYGSVGLAHSQGYIFLTIYMGVTLACLFIPLLWLPLLRIVRQHQLASLADLFALRYQSQTTGAVVTVFMLVISLPYLALQVRAVTSSAATLAQLEQRPPVALAFCGFIILFAVLFGARHAGGRERHPGLVVAVALESLVKLAALLVIGGFALFGVLDGPDGLSQWLEQHPEALENLYAPVRDGPWITLMLLAFSAAFMLPRQFHMAFTEDPSDRSLKMASWAFPILLLLLNLPVPLLLWAGERLAPGANPDMHVLVVASKHPVLSVLAFIGGVSASSAMVIVCSIALASMTVNHIVLPLWRPRNDLYRQMAWVRRAVVVGIVFATYAFYLALERVQNLASLGLVSFVGVAQFLPALFGTLLWARLNRTGILTGILAGFSVWLAMLVLPLLGGDAVQVAVMSIAGMVDDKWSDIWTTSTVLSLGLNAFLAAGVSITTRTRPQERRAASLCTIRALPVQEAAKPRTPDDLRNRMAEVLGEAAAQEELERATALSRLPENAPYTPAQLERLSSQLESNLSGLVGPLLARAILGRKLDFATSLADQVLFLERRKELPRNQRLSRDAEQIEHVRRYLRRVLEDLPVGVTVTSHSDEVVLWNRAMVEITGLSVDDCLGSRLQMLPEPWGHLLAEGKAGEHAIELDNRTVQVGLGVSALDGSSAGDRVILVQDLTATKQLEAQVAHQERLASVGRLAAGVAHEIGNPLTGVLVLARNLKAESEPEDLHERLGLIIAEAEKIERIVGTMVTFSRKGPTVGSGAEWRNPVGLHRVIDDAVRLVDLAHKDRQIRFDVAVPADISVWGDAPQLEQVFVNVLANACDASPSGAPVVLKAAAVNGEVRVDVRDRGTGMSPAVQAQVFEPFFTTKPAGEGTGLGLAIVYGIITEHRGRLELDSRPGEGTELRIWLERAPRE